jgi:PAS domain S-box-containing protein
MMDEEEYSFDREIMEEDLKASEEKYREIFNNAGDMISINLIREDGLPCNFIDVNKIGIERLGYTFEEFLKMTPKDIVAPDNQSEMPDNDLNLYEKGYVNFEIIHQAKDGKKIPVEVNKQIFQLKGKNVGLAISRDISERKKVELQLIKDLQEKEVLLKEIHHRVKNNFMIISSLLNLQSQYIEDVKSQEYFMESQNRARSMAIIHEKLYQSTDLQRIDFGEYIRSLATELFHTYNADQGSIKLKINAQNILLDINIAIPLGLIVNELITNSLKHAFPHGMLGEINVNFHSSEEHYEFIVKDNGIGLPEDINFRNSNSLGLQMIKVLTSQINGQIELYNDKGTEFKIKFKELE